jgi:endogenous inhibitor of DNA gyrase (YacG/DUF329 family)
VTTEPKRPPRRCPICNRAVPPGTSRFCSERCATVDLGRWLGGTYAIPVRPGEEPEDEP